MPSSRVSQPQMKAVPDEVSQKPFIAGDSGSTARSERPASVRSTLIKPSMVRASRTVAALLR